MRGNWLASTLLIAITATQAQNAPVPPPTQEGYVCSVFLRDIGLPDKALVFALTSEPDCQGEWEWNHNFACPTSGNNPTNDYACSATEYSASELQIIHDQLMAAAARRLKVFAVHGPCRSPMAQNTCFHELGYMSRPASRPKAGGMSGDVVPAHDAAGSTVVTRKQP